VAELYCNVKIGYIPTCEMPLLVLAMKRRLAATHSGVCFSIVKRSA
jgi:hypothetical protein